ncbi:MAG: PaaI family thioesterase [Dehalococcoidia bacterium]
MRGRVVVRPELMNPHVTLHGGVMYSLADQSMGAAVYTRLEPGESCATIEIKMVYIAAVREGTLDCETRVVNKGRRVAVLESEVRNGVPSSPRRSAFAIFPIPTQRPPSA